MFDDRGMVDQSIENRDISDHTPISLRVGLVDWGPKPFRFNNVWFNHKDFKSFISEEWGKFNVIGKGDSILFEKLRRLKASLHVWNKEVFGWIDLKVKEEVDSLNVLDKLLVENIGDNMEALVDSRRKVSKELWHNLNLKESMLRLKSSQLWLKEGDKNTRFYHNSIKDRQRISSISSLEGRNGRVEGVANIKKEVLCYFQEFFNEENNERPIPEDLLINRLCEEDAKGLERPFSKEEIREAVSISDGVLVVNKVMDLDKREKRNCVVLKVDFVKAYDRVSWSFLRYVLGRMGFGVRWMRWMEGCIFSNSMSVLINGSTTLDVKVEKRLRQGDPLSPIFICFGNEGSDDFNEESKRKLESSEDLRINVGNFILEATSKYLSCKVGYLSFKFLGVKVGGNPRNLSMWKELLAFLWKWLAVWKGKNLSKAGRVVLINSVLNAIPIYSLSFYKAPTKMLGEIQSIQSNFLWSGGDLRRTIHWVCWDTVYKYREEGSFGVKNVEIMNVALIIKWELRILVENDAIWCGVLKARYGNSKCKVLIGDVSVVGNKDSIWWRDVLLSDNYDCLLDKHFAGAVDVRVGNGDATPFWYACWFDQAVH
ncbi:uncharacterized protein LOC131596956 [Vicia villosa]|uniref:uncharacterized protein LOC131596956 n=1 Tax=Vicia villosa TaxID=3911 RepID=UPI00273B377F|nr:uncharacterized protein LOC131596956 [Vicia villosa]